MKTGFVAIAFGLLSAIVISIFALVTTPLNLLGYSLAYTSGVSMIFLPCTLPLVLLVVPLSVSAGPRRGVVTALFFGLGVMVALLIFGIFTASLGGYFGLNQSMRMVLVVAGVLAYAFALNMLGMLRIESPTNLKLPTLLSRNKYYLAPFFFGLFLGDAGIGCPNPAFYLLLGYIASTADLTQGAILGFLHGLGRAVPLIFISVLAVLGTNLSTSLARNVKKVYAATGVMMLFIGSWILTVGVFGDWFELTVFHEWWDAFIYDLMGPTIAEREMEFIHLGILSNGWQFAIWIMLTLFAVPVAFWAGRNRIARLLPSKRRLNLRGASLVKLGVLVVLTTSLASYINTAPSVQTSFEEMRELGFPFRYEEPHLHGVDFVAEPASGFGPLTVNFSLRGTFGVLKNVAVQYWDWGDGFVSGAGGTSWSHTYDEPGVYQVQATVYAGGGCGISPTVYEMTTTVVVN